MSEQMNRVMRVLADTGPTRTNGAYCAQDVSPAVLGPRFGNRSAAASLARTLARLERRGLIARQPYGGHRKKSPYRYFRLTPDGLKVVNALRESAGKPPVPPDVCGEPRHDPPA